jgi:hypothetical protein
LSDLPGDGEIARINAEHLITTPLRPAFSSSSERGAALPRPSTPRSSSGGAGFSVTLW